MFRKLSLVLLIFLLIGVWAVRGQNEGELPKNIENENWVMILDMPDPLGDDYGPGTYLYPTHPQFSPYQGLFDIESFKVEARKEEIRFQISFGLITNPWHAPFGFSHQLIQIYIDHRPGGERRPLVPGARIVFSPKAPWDTLIKVTGWRIDYFDCEETGDEEAYAKQYSGGTVQVLEDEKTIEIKIPLLAESSLEDISDASFYLLVGGQDGFGSDNYRVVKENISEWYFGGGDESKYSPNVIDILTPSHKSQKKILGSYDPANRILAVVEPVKRPNPVRKVFIYLISLLIVILIWFGWRIREKEEFSS
ncbi:MAG: hypothetical protein KAX49_06435 [Halanaerobiales bacterium]|nr:hypothetical protein [Halanaerobiales bacterium]